MKRTALVTGGTRGIGEAISRQLHNEGFRVIASYVSRDEAANNFVERTGIKAIKFDVSDYEATLEVVVGLDREWDGIDVLVNNAGLCRDSMLHRMKADDWHRVIQTNLGSCFNTCRAVIAGMRERGFGRIINISSVNGQSGQAGQTNYAAAKAGMLGFTKALALETAGRGITVNAVAPGYIDTDMVKTLDTPMLDKIIGRIPVGRLGQVSEVARAVSFLASEEAGYITGATLSINGGQQMC